VPGADIRGVPCIKSLPVQCGSFYLNVEKIAQCRRIESGMIIITVIYEGQRPYFFLRASSGISFFLF